jgi:hypothetical protein
MTLGFTPAHGSTSARAAHQGPPAGQPVSGNAADGLLSAVSQSPLDEFEQQHQSRSPRQPLDR